MRFSVVIPVYNRPKFIREAIDSVFAQTFKDFELIIMDDGSTDDTIEVLKSYNLPMKVLSQPHQGGETGRRNGARHAQGEYLVFLDSDDFLCSGALATYDHIIKECSSPPLIIGRWVTFMVGSPLPAGWVSGATRVGVCVSPDCLSKDIAMGLSNSLIVIRKSTLEKLGGPQRPPTNLFFDNFYLCFQAGTASPCGVVRKPITMAYRLHPNNVHQNPEGNVRAFLSVVDYERRGGYPGGKARRKERYLWIGSIGLHWIRKWLAARTPKYIYPLVRHGSPMLTTASARKIGKYMGITRTEPLLVLNGKIESLTDRRSQTATA